MSQWQEDFSTCSLEDIFTSQAENRAWSKELRLKGAALVNSRLAKAISQDEYTENRKVSHTETAECRRRAAILLNEINGRRAG
jgi:hypothetical protein